MYRRGKVQQRFVSRVRRAVAVLFFGLVVGALVSPSVSLAGGVVDDSGAGLISSLEDGVGDSPLVP